METKVLIGKIEYFSPNGASYTSYFEDEEEYLRAIAEELHCGDRVIATTHRSCRSFHYGEVSMCESLH